MKYTTYVARRIAARQRREANSPRRVTLTVAQISELLTGLALLKDTLNETRDMGPMPNGKESQADWDARVARWRQELDARLSTLEEGNRILDAAMRR